MRELINHRINPCNSALAIECIDTPGEDGAHKAYDIIGFDTAKNPASVDEGGYRREFSRNTIVFQNGEIKSGGKPNGITNEVLLAILIDRIEGFQRGKYACEENRITLGFLRSAMEELEKRCTARTARGVEGTHTV